MHLIVKNFSELSTLELYEIIKSRTEIFLLEQHIICQDLDDFDKISTHFFYMENNRIIAYLRAIPKEKEIQLGRILTLHHGLGYGKKLMKETLSYIKEKTPYRHISMHAQKHAVPFYEKLGFCVTSDEFLEENVIHVKMEMSI